MIVYLVIFIILGIFIVVFAIFEIKKEKLREIQETSILVSRIDHFLALISNAQTLDELYILHIQIWEEGIRNKNIGPDQFGMFRTDDILKMTPDQVYLGNIHGLWTNNIPFWREAPIKERFIVTNQYRQHLRRNLLSIKSHALLNKF